MSKQKIVFFQAVALEWIAKFSHSWTAEHAKRITSRLERDIFPLPGACPINLTASPEILKTLRRTESRGALDTAHRAMQNGVQVFRYAVASGLAEGHPAADSRGALPPVKAKHHASITDPIAVGELMRAIDGYEGFFVMKYALSKPCTVVH